MNTIARIDSSNTRTTRGISDRTVCNTNREHKSCTLLSSSSSSLCFSVFEKCEFLLSIEREKKKRKRRETSKRTKNDRSSHFPPQAQSRDDPKRVARDREEKSRGSDVSKTFGVVVCEPRVVRRAFAFVRVDGRSGAVFEKRLYRERDVERDR